MIRINNPFEENEDKNQELIKKLVETNPINAEFIENTNEEIDKIINQSKTKLDDLLSILLQKIDDDFESFIYHFSEEYNNAKNKLLEIDKMMPKTLDIEAKQLIRKIPHLKEKVLHDYIRLAKHTLKNSVVKWYVK